jgi:hypothetical protein
MYDNDLRLSTRKDNPEPPGSMEASQVCTALEITDRQLDDLVTHEIFDDWTVVGSSRLFRTCQVREYLDSNASRKFSGSALKWSFFRKVSRHECKAVVPTVAVLPAFRAPTGRNPATCHPCER